MSKYRQWRRGRWTIDGDIEFRRPRLFFWNMHDYPSDVVVDLVECRGGISLEWGTPHADPLWRIGYEFPEWLSRRLPEWYPS